MSGGTATSLTAGPRPSVEAPKSLWIVYADKLAADCATLREKLNRSYSYRESQEGLPEGTIPRV